jgi:hypothetical protein
VTAAGKAVGRAAVELGEHLGPFKGAEGLLRTPHPGGVADGIVVADTLEARTARVLETAHGMVGRLRWSPNEVSLTHWSLNLRTSNGFQNDFARWMRGGPEPTLDDSMNCWEALMFIAYRVKAVDRATLKAVHSEATRAARSAARYYRRKDAGYEAWDKSIRDYLGPGQRTRIRLGRRDGVGTEEIPAGHLVFMDDLDHVALSTGTRDAQGRHEIISHWTVPDVTPPPQYAGTMYGVVQKTTLEEVVSAGWSFIPRIESAAPTWLVPGRWGVVI